MAGVALVAGASSGLGRAVAERLAAEGFRTYAGARSFAGKASGLRKEPPQGCIPVALDVTSDESVHAAIGTIMAAEGRIDALINCAAFLTLGSCEETSDAELRAVMETNLLGTARMVRGVLPVMRAQGGGRIVQFSSLNGRFAIPFQGAYTASKHAIEGWSEALALEVRKFGISVTLVEPGDCRSGADAYRTHADAASQMDSPYHAYYGVATAKIHHDEATGMQPQRVAGAVARVLQRRRAPMRVTVARIDQRLALWLHGLLPGRFFARIIGWYYGAGTSARRQHDQK